MNSFIKYYLAVLCVVVGFAGVQCGSAFALQMTIDAVDDAGQSPGQSAFLKLVYPSGPHDVTTQEVPNPWTSSSQASSYASIIVPQNPPEEWHFESAGNIWSPDNGYIVGDALINLPAGIYRVSVVAGAFQYDSFNWSDYKGLWWWQLHIQSSMLPQSVILGDTNPFPTDAEALANSSGESIDIPVNERGSLTFWIWDTNTIDNSGSLTFNVTLIPEPSTFILAGTGLLFLTRFIRRHRNLY